MRAGRKVTSRAVDPMRILLQPRLDEAEERFSGITDDCRDAILSRFNDIKDDVKKRRRRRIEIRWLLKMNKTERQEERQSKDLIYDLV